MLIVLLVISIILLIIGFVLYENDIVDVLGITLGIIGIIGIIIFTIGIIVAGVNYSNILTIDKKISTYEEENKKISNTVQEIVNNYKDYENNNYDKYLEKIDIKNTDIIALGQLFPELKSNELVSKQIDLYIKNNNEIKKLKIKKQDLAIDKWWLCFSTKID